MNDYVFSSRQIAELGKARSHSFHKYCSNAQSVPHAMVGAWHSIWRTSQDKAIIMKRDRCYGAGGKMRNRTLKMIKRICPPPATDNCTCHVYAAQRTWPWCRVHAARWKRPAAPAFWRALTWRGWGRKPTKWHFQASMCRWDTCLKSGSFMVYWAWCFLQKKYAKSFLP